MKLPQPSTKTEPFNTEVRGKARRTMVHMLIGAVAFVLLVVTVLLSVYFGMKMTKDNNNKEYKAIYIVDEGVVHQNITVTDREEIFTTDVATTIVDFSTGLITTHFKKPELYADICYVTNLNFNESQTPTEFTSTHKNTQITFEKEDMVTVTYVVTDMWLHPKALGHRSAQMCEGKIPLFLREKKDVTARAKRFDNSGENSETYRATKEAYHKAAHERKIATGPYKAARDAYVAATATYTKSFYE